jgi:hypothetical protein
MSAARKFQRRPRHSIRRVLQSLGPRALPPAPQSVPELLELVDRVDAETLDAVIDAATEPELLRLAEVLEQFWQVEATRMRISSSSEVSVFEH